MKRTSIAIAAPIADKGITRVPALGKSFGGAGGIGIEYWLEMPNWGWIVTDEMSVAVANM